MFEGDDDNDGFVPKTMLSVPIFNRQHQVIGVAQLINKVKMKIKHYLSYLDFLLVFDFIFEPSLENNLVGMGIYYQGIKIPNLFE